MQAVDSKKRPFVLLNTRVEQTIKKAKTNGSDRTTPCTMLTKVAVTVDYSMCKVNAIWMNTADIAQLWQPQSARLVSIGNRLFTVLEMASLPQGTVLLNYIQYKQIQHTKFSLQGTDHIVVTPAPKPWAEYSTASKLKISIEPLDNKRTPPVFSLEYLREKMKKVLHGQVLSHLQEYYVEKSGYKFRLTVHFPEGENFDAYKRLSTETVIDFIGSSNPIICNNNLTVGPEDGRTAAFEITSFQPSGDKIKNCMVDVDKLKAMITETIRKEKYYIEGMEEEIKNDKDQTFKILCKRISKDSPSKTGEGYKTLYHFDETSKFDVNLQVSPGNKQLQLYSGTRNASKMGFTISRNDANNKTENLKHWVSAEKLTRLVKGFPGFSLDWEINKDSKRNPLKFKVTDITSPQYPKDRPYPPLTQIVDNTELTFISKDKTLTIVDNDSLKQIAQITIGIKKHVKDEAGKATLVKEKLEELCRSFLWFKTWPRRTMSFWYELNPQKKTELQIEVEEMKFVGDPKAKYGYLGELTDQTKFEFKIPPEEELAVVEKKDLDSQTGALDLFQLESVVGGVAEQLKEIVRKVGLSRGIYKEEFKKRGLNPIKGMLLFGPPGTGKTTLARNIGRIFGCKGDRFQMITGPELTDKYVGETEKRIRELFEPAEKAQKKDGENSELHIIVMDECESILCKRQANSNHPWMNSQVNQFLGKIDGMQQLNNIFVILMSNRKDIIDPAVLRPGRIELHLELSLADQEGRKQIINIHTKTMKEANLLQDIDINKLAEMTAGLTGAEIEGIVKDASSYSLERMDKLKLTKEQAATHEGGKVTMNDFEVAVQTYFAKQKN